MSEDPEDINLSDDADAEEQSVEQGAEEPFVDLGSGDGAGDPFAELDEGDGGEADPFADIEGVDVEDDPFSDFDIGDAPEEDPSDNSLFTEMGGSGLDDDDVWSQLDDGEAVAESGAEQAAELGSEELDEATDAATVEERVVRKRAYCEQCEYFSEPPGVSCTYPDAEILELVDTERFRVRNCPIVERRENSDITAIAGKGGDEPELEPGDPTAAADSGSDD